MTDLSRKTVCKGLQCCTIVVETSCIQCCAIVVVHAGQSVMMKGVVVLGSRVSRVGLSQCLVAPQGVREDFHLVACSWGDRVCSGCFRLAVSC